MPLVGVRRVAIVAVFFSMFLLASMSITVFGSSEEWVEVMRITRSGSAFINSGLFTIDYPEWRIMWQFDPGDHWHFADLHFLNVTTYPEGEFETYIDQIYGSGNQNSGIHYIHDSMGKFYIKINTGMIESFAITVEQNIEAIPEFPSWTILPLLLATTLTVILYRKKLHRTPNPTTILDS